MEKSTYSNIFPQSHLYRVMQASSMPTFTAEATHHARVMMLKQGALMHSETKSRQDVLRNFVYSETRLLY